MIQSLDHLSERDLLIKVVTQMEDLKEVCIPDIQKKLDSLNNVDKQLRPDLEVAKNDIATIKTESTMTRKLVIGLIVVVAGGGGTASIMKLIEWL